MYCSSPPPTSLLIRRCQAPLSRIRSTDYPLTTSGEWCPCHLIICPYNLPLPLVPPLLRAASTLLYVSSLIARLMQCHVGFLVVWRKESEVRERDRCFARQPSHKLNFRTTRQLNYHYTSFSCHATYNIPFFIYTN